MPNGDDHFYPYDRVLDARCVTGSATTCMALTMPSSTSFGMNLERLVVREVSVSFLVISTKVYRIDALFFEIYMVVWALRCHNALIYFLVYFIYIAMSTTGVPEVDGQGNNQHRPGF